MSNKTKKIYDKFDDSYSKKYYTNTKIEKSKNDSKQYNINSSNKNITFREYYPKNKISKQQIHRLESNKKPYYPKSITRFNVEEHKKDEYAKIEDEEDDYSGLAVNNQYYPKYSETENKKPKMRRSEDLNDFKTKWKTEMCHYWEMYGFCKFGDSCAFAHGVNELNQRKMSTNYKTKPCRQFFELGYCNYGQRCQFSHKLFKEGNQKKSEEKKFSYYKILSEFNDQSDKISHELIKRPRLMTFEKITSSTNEQAEKNRLKLYEDIIEIKRKEIEEPEHVFSDDNTNDENSEKFIQICNNGGGKIEDKRGRFISI